MWTTLSKCGFVAPVGRTSTSSVMPIFSMSQNQQYITVNSILVGHKMAKEMDLKQDKEALEVIYNLLPRATRESFSTYLSRTSSSCVV